MQLNQKRLAASLVSAKKRWIGRTALVSVLVSGTVLQSSGARTILMLKTVRLMPQQSFATLTLPGGSRNAGTY